MPNLLIIYKEKPKDETAPVEEISIDAIVNSIESILNERGLKKESTRNSTHTIMNKYSSEKASVLGIFARHNFKFALFGHNAYALLYFENMAIDDQLLDRIAGMSHQLMFYTTKDRKYAYQKRLDEILGHGKLSS